MCLASAQALSFCVGFLPALWFPPTDQKAARLFSSSGTFPSQAPPVVLLAGFARAEEARGGVDAELSAPVRVMEAGKAGSSTESVATVTSEEFVLVQGSPQGSGGKPRLKVRAARWRR